MKPLSYKAAAGASAPSPPNPSSDGYPTEGDVTQGTPATTLGEWWFYQLDAELQHLLTHAGLTPDTGDLEQVRKAVEAIGGGSRAVLASDITLSADARATAALTRPLDDFRWIELLMGPDSSTYDRVVKVQRADITARTGAVTWNLYALVRIDANNKVKFYRVNPATGAFTDLTGGNGIDLPYLKTGLGMARLGGVIYLLRGGRPYKDAGGDGSLLTVDPETSTVSDPLLMQSFGGVATGIGMAAHGGALWAVVQSTQDSLGEAHMYRLDLSTRQVAFVRRFSNVATGYPNAFGLTDHNGVLYMVRRVGQFGKGALFSLDVSGAALVSTQIGSLFDFTLSGVAPTGAGLASHQGNLYAIVRRNAEGEARLYSVDPTAASNAAAFTLISSHDVGANANAIAMVSAPSSTVAGGAVFGDLRLDRDGASSLGLDSARAAHVHQVIGVE